MSRKIWLVLALAALIATSFAASVVAVRRASEDRPTSVTRGLDYLHARQGDDGGFTTPQNTAWAMLGAVASGERMGSSAWTRKGKNPFEYLQSTDLAAAATGITVDNPPVYYAQVIMSYVVVGKGGRVGTAGSKGVNLLKLMTDYQDTLDASPNRGAFSPLVGTTTNAVETTAWAILALQALEQNSSTSFKLAADWLSRQQLADGGFAVDPEEKTSVTDSGLAIQALRAAGASVAGNWGQDAARSFLKANQTSAGGFRAVHGGTMNANATSASIQAILALGENPESADWRVGLNTPIDGLHRLQRKTGMYRSSASVSTGSLPVTSWALVALNRRPFTTYPKNPGPSHRPFVFRPEFVTVLPKNGAKFTGTHIVLIRATYTDHKKGTGIKPSACRLYVDDVNRSRAADIGSYGLHLQLKNVPNGDHTYKIQLQDRAGNTKVVERKFTVAVPTPTPTGTPTTRPTVNPGPVFPTTFPTHTSTTKPYTTPTTTPYPTGTPYPYGSPTSSAGPVVTGSPVPSPSASASPAGTGTGGGGSAAGFVGGTLLAMLPIGAVVSYLLLRRREELLGSASQGTVLDGGGSAWERFKHMLAKSKDLTRPSSRE